MTNKRGRSTIERHPDRERIERDLALGKPLAAIAAKYKISKDAAWRHKEKLPPQMKAGLAASVLAPGQDLEKLRIDESEGLLARLAHQRVKLLLAQDVAFELDQLGLVSQLAGQIHRNIELVAKYLGVFAQHQVQTNINLLVTPEYLTLRAIIIEALAEYPDARRKVAEKIRAMEAEAAERMRQTALADAKTIERRP